MRKNNIIQKAQKTLDEIQREAQSRRAERVVASAGNQFGTGLGDIIELHPIHQNQIGEKSNSPHLDTVRNSIDLGPTSIQQNLEVKGHASFRSKKLSILQQDSLMQSMTESQPTDRSVIEPKNRFDKGVFDSNNVSMESPGDVKCPPLQNIGVLRQQQINERARYDRKQGKQFVRGNFDNKQSTENPSRNNQSNLYTSPTKKNQSILSPQEMQKIEQREIVKMRPHVPAYQIFGINNSVVPSENQADGPFTNTSSLDGVSG